MVLEHHVERENDQILLGIYQDYVVLDILTTYSAILDALSILNTPHKELVNCQLGSFGVYPITLNVHHDETVSVFVDGPYFSRTRNQCFEFILKKKNYVEF